MPACEGVAAVRTCGQWAAAARATAGLRQRAVPLGDMLACFSNFAKWCALPVEKRGMRYEVRGMRRAWWMASGNVETG